jgi:glyoxylase-like metal-dependent hydrolase (beta-lactamase superfamily II)
MRRSSKPGDARLARTGFEGLHMGKRMLSVWVGGVLCGFLCVLSPTSAQGQPRLISADKLTQVSPHVWMIRDFPNIGFVVGTTGTLVIDTGLGAKNGQIVSAVARRLSTHGQKRYLTTTHYHTEHASGDIGFPPGTIEIRPRVQQIEMNSEEPKQVEMNRSRSEDAKALLENFRIIQADVLFDKNYTLNLGGGVLAKLYWFGFAHTKGDELIMVEPDSVLFSGDVVQNKAGPNFYICTECTPHKWLAVLDQVARELKPNIIVPDHSDVGDISLIAEERGMFDDLQSRAMALKAQGKSADEAGKIIAEEFREKYQGWTALNNIDQAVHQAYSDPG